jgi:hypothetical protein
MTAPTINHIVRTYAPAYHARYGDAMPAVQRKAVQAIIACRTPAQGSTVYRCEDCGQHHHVPRSCGNRHCPLCQHAKSQHWLARQLERQLPGHHFFLTFTVPEPLRAFLRSHQREGYAALFAASAAAIKVLAADPKRLAAEHLGFLGVLHTWGRTLNYHPHIHYLVPGGVLAGAEHLHWQPTSTGFFLPVRALSRLYRARFRHAMHKAALLEHIPPDVWSTEWNVHCQSVPSAEAALHYLAPYIFRVAISNARIVALEHDHVCFRYRKPGSSRARLMRLHALEFLRRFLQHVLPTGFMKVRYFGLLSPSCAIPIEELRARIELASAFTLSTPRSEPVQPQPMQCPDCGGSLHYRASIPSRQPAGTSSMTTFLHKPHASPG